MRQLTVVQAVEESQKVPDCGGFMDTGVAPPCVLIRWHW